MYLPRVTENPMNKDQMIAYTILTAPGITCDRVSREFPYHDRDSLCFEANSKELQIIRYFGRSFVIPAEAIAE